ncbi:hypothetical protein DRQ25_18245 [Candidatus Fermentibacteria bacterium]|nr:MAG: hypothetical protein DRQ25_18245 [Candidatus Fermentibacteria bacterium]
MDVTTAAFGNEIAKVAEDFWTKNKPYRQMRDRIETGQSLARAEGASKAGKVKAVFGRPRTAGTSAAKPPKAPASSTGSSRGKYLRIGMRE